MINMTPRLGRPLTPRELQVGALVALGLTTQEVADELGISSNVSKFHAANIAAKLGQRTRAGVAAELVRRGICP